MENFKAAITEILEVDSVELTDDFASFEVWDSLTILSIIAYAEETHGVSLSAEVIEGIGTIKNLQELIKSKI